DNINSPISNQVEHIYQDPAGILWLATAGGLIKFDIQTETFTHYAEKEGLASKAIASVVGDAQGNLWVGMQGSGLARFDPLSGTFRNYNRSDGLQGDDFMPRGAYRDASGKLYFGGINGLNAFYPDQLHDNPYIPPVVLTDFQIFNRPVPIGGKDSLLQQVINETGEITLSYQQSVFSFEFAALSYRAPRKNQYAYKLEGFDEDWNYVGSDRRFATYTNLNPGTYTFQVKASNNDGVWNEEGKTIKITVTPPWWKTWWFYTLCVAGVLGVFGMIYLTKVDQLKAERQTALVLRESERRFQILAEAPFEGIALTENGMIVDLNDQMAHMFGYARDEMIGKPVMEIIASESRELVAEAIRSGRLEPYEHLALRKDGTLFPVETRARAIQMNSRQLRVSAIRDITERKQAETERERLIIELENRNAELERFTYTVSHDLKSPLITIRGFLGYIEQNALSGNIDRLKGDLQRISAATDKMQRLLNELLELSRIGRLMNPPENIVLGN
ncbi:MAG TPA: triple tyrosine motif-containing protein, partial [Anaerolineales bacterium]|nr:triple tyrosine motif-containing protein [Anaerolineales bacterium]